MLTPAPQATATARDRSTMGRPVLFHKPLPKTFMMSEEASAILSRKAEEMKCSRSDVLEAAIRHFNRKRSKKA